MEILVADDDPASVKLTSFLLEDAGYKVIKAYDAASVLQAVEQRSPDLVLLDVGMPKVNGFDICRQIRRISDVPIIFVTGSSQLQDRVTGLQIGGDDYLVKPFEPAELLARVEAVLRRRNSDLVNPVTRISQGPLTLDPIEHTVLFEDGRSVVLTPIEFRLLYYLMQNAGRVLSASQILSKVWGYDYEGESNLVAVYIRRLRAKIEPDIDAPRYIITVRNLGYKFAVQDR
ncbi:MAG: response regulator transcription factor [Roseiflexus sp.]|jgi:DNA-binding response OmpR family regulator|nr:response regulator transcription factor [Roseiflexus sp.]MBO9365959.1 response regulator transcription factor [Roseiflexus sp.]MBO9390716.1 response regulator transcription factor [Roseiflexus sp.]